MTVVGVGRKKQLKEGGAADSFKELGIRTPHYIRTVNVNANRVRQVI